MAPSDRVLDAALDRLVDQVRDAAQRKAALEIRGGGSKAFYGELPRGELLDLRPLRGISSYEPSELVVTVRAGTPLAELEAALAEAGQCLPFDPPRFSEGGTVGGMVAAGLAGPARAAAGSVRDYVLGLTLLNGKGELLSFGGQVMKNVAGYDVSRLIAGSLGILGVICEVSLKVLPLAPATATRVFDLSESEALARLNAWMAKPLPLNASVWHRNRLTLRLSGARAAVASACAQLGGTALDDEAAAKWWCDIRDQQHEFFGGHGEAGRRALWRLSLLDATPPLSLADGFSSDALIEWGGTQRWLATSAAADPAAIRRAAAQAGGHATLFRTAAGPARQGVFTPLAAPLLAIHRGLKDAFDPARIFNPGRLYPDL